jgi:hypothetical protein
MLTNGSQLTLPLTHWKQLINYIQGWVAGFLNNPEIEEQRITDEWESCAFERVACVMLPIIIHKKSPVIVGAFLNFFAISD